MSTNINSTEQIVEINAGDQITNVNIVSQSTTQVISGEQVVTVDVNAGTIPAAWGSITGTLSNQTDLQNALNAKQNNITLTTTGTTGVATLVGATLNIPNYVSSTKQAEWDSAYNDKINSAEVSGTTTKTLTLTQQDGGIIQASWSDFDTAPVTSVFGRTGDVVATEGDYNINQLGDVTITSATNGQVLKYNGTAWVNAADASGLTSVGLAMPSAFTVSGSPLTSNGTITVTGAGTTAQYVRGDGSLAAFPSVSNEAKTLIREVYNKTGATLTKGTVIYIDGGQGNLPTVTKAIATGDPTSAQTFGIVQSDITNMNNGFVVVAGGIDNLDTQAYTEGTALYLSPTTAGAWTITKPYAPDHMVYLGVVVRSHPTQGVIEVKIQNGVELDEIHDVSARFPTNKDGIFYNSTSGVWENKSIAGVLGYTPVPQSRIITINGNAQDLSEDRTYNVGTVTSVAASGGTGISVAGSPVTGSGTITITNTAPDQVVGLTGAGTTSISGTYPNFTITSNDQYTGTVTSVAASGGTGISISGSPITSSGTINITNTAPDQIVSLTGAGTTSISGTYPNFTVTSNDQYVGTVTSVNATVPTGFEVSGVPITSAGTVDIKFASGYSLPTNAKQSEWDTAYTKRLDSLTVTGNSGSATLTSNVLNVPTYTLTGLGGEPAITAGTTSQYWRGDKTFQTLNTSVVPESGNVYFTEPRVRATVLSGLNITGGSISASDSVLNAFGKVQNQINGLIGGSIFQSTWNASTNTPTLASGVGTKGYYYIVSVAGTTNLDGITDWQIGDWAIFDGTVWRKVDNTDAVVSVNGYTGVVSLVLDDLADVSAASPTDTQLLRFNGTTSKWYNWTPTYISGNETIILSGDVTGTGTTSITTSIGAGKVTNAMLAGSINYAKMDSATVPTWNQDTTGNAATADKWKTARTLTIGATGKSVDGSGNVTWSASEIGLTNYLPLAGGTMTGVITSSVNQPFEFTYNSNTGTYTKSTILVNQNNDTGDVSNGIFIERGKLTDAIGGETRYFVIGSRGSGVQWKLSGTGYSTQYDTAEVKASADGNDLFVGRLSSGTAKLFRVYQSSSDGYLELRTGTDAVVTKLSGYEGTPNYTLAKLGIGKSSNIDIMLDVYGGETNSHIAQFDKQASGAQSDGIIAKFINSKVETGYSSYIYIGSAPSTDWKIGKNITDPGTNAPHFEITDQANNLALRINNSTKAASFTSSVTASSLIKSGGTSTQYLMADGSTSTLTDPVTGTGSSNQIALWNGQNTITGSATFTYSATGQLTVNNTSTATGGIGRGAYFTPTLVAAANNDSLTAISISPTFTNGAFTGVTNTALSVTGSAVFSSTITFAGGTSTGDITISGQRVKDLTTTNKGVYIGNWGGAGYWGLGSSANSHEVKIDQVTAAGVWEDATDVNLILGSNRTVLHSSNYSSYALPLAGGTMTGSIASTNTQPLIFIANSNTGSFNRSSIYVAQNNTSGSTGNGIFIERGRITDTVDGEVRYLVIGARGGTIQWMVDGTGYTTQYNSAEVKPSADGNYFIGRHSGSANIPFRAYQSAGDGYIDLGTGAGAVVTKLSGYTGTPNYTLAKLGIGKSSSITYTLDVDGGSTNSYAASFVKQAYGEGYDGAIARFINNISEGYSSYILIGSNPGTDWKIGKNISAPTTAVYNFEIVDSNDNLRMSINAVSGNTTFNGNVTANALIKSGGTSSQYLMADGSVSTLSNPVTGTGTQNFLPVWNNAGGTTLGNSKISQPDGNNVVINFADVYAQGARFTYNSTYVSSLTLGRTGTGMSSNATFIYDIEGTEIFEIRRNYSANTFKISLNNGTAVVDHFLITSAGDTGIYPSVSGGGLTIGKSTTAFALGLYFRNDANTTGNFIGLARTANQFITGTAAGDMAIGLATGEKLVIGNGQTGTTEYARITSTGLSVTGTGAFSSSLSATYASLSSTQPLEFTGGSNTGTYNKTTIYSAQNNTSNSNANGIFIERGRITDSSSAEVRHFVIGARGGSIQWQVDGTGYTTQYNSVEVKPSGDGNYFVGRYSGGSATPILLYQSGADGYMELRTGANNIVTKLSGYTGTPNYTLANWGIGLSSGIDVRLVVDGGSTTGAAARFQKQSSSADGRVAEFINNSNGGYSSYVYIGSNPGTDWKIGKNISNPTGATYHFEIVDSSNNLRMRITSTTGAVDFSNTVTATGFFESSDMRLKSNIQNYTSSDILNISAKIYEKDGQIEVGYLAQDLQSVLGSAVSVRENGYLDLSYRQVHTAKISALEQKIKELEEIIKTK